jgi:hypothetical protein
MSVTAMTKLRFFWRDGLIPKEFRAGVSLHSHTMHSKESLEMVPRYTKGVPYLGAAIRRQQAEYCRKKGRNFDFQHAFWTPPLTPRQAYRLEEKQIQRRLQLPALVSLTDHDDVQAGILLQVLDRYRNVPVSTEWTIPVEPTFFHLGVHNLPAAKAAAIMEELAAFTANPQEKDLAGILATLNGYPDLLLVLNHPLWDEKGIGAANHKQVLRRFLGQYGGYFHALELNGLRGWQENKDVMLLGRETGLPLVSGGDRHGREPNAILNLSRGSSMVGFIHEIRYQRSSHVVFMPQYHEPLKLRILQTMVDIVREYPENLPGRRSWAERVFFRDNAGAPPVPLSSIWNDGGPKIVRQFIAAMRLLESRSVRSLLRVALDDRSKVWQVSVFGAMDPDQEPAT